MPPTVEVGARLGSTTRPLVLATISFALSFAAWGLIGGLASVFAALYGLNASQTALLVAVPVLLGPTTPGEYPFLCTFAGHYQAGMKGTLVVDEEGSAPEGGKTRAEAARSVTPRGNN